MSAASPSPALPACGACGAGLPEALWNAPDLAPCPACAVPVAAAVFPAFHRGPERGAAAESLLAPGEAACFFHAQKRAVVACSRCGVFLCALCDLPIGAEHLCPRCLETGVARRKLPSLENHRFLYDQLALSLAVAPLVIFYFTLLTAPATVFVVIRYWNAPRSLVRPGRVRMVAALLVALLEIAGWILLAGFLYVTFTRRRGLR